MIPLRLSKFGHHISRPLLDGARDVVLVPDAAHQLMQEQPDECNAQVRAFVASLGR
jgi:pimeloyl-ACP methyl ester carboxylesterase